MVCVGYDMELYNALCEQLVKSDSEAKVGEGGGGGAGSGSGTAAAESAQALPREPVTGAVKVENGLDGLDGLDDLDILGADIR